MSYARALLAGLLLVGALGVSVWADEEETWHLGAATPQGYAWYDEFNHVWVGTNGVYFSYSGTLINADSMIIHPDSGEIIADGNVRIQHQEQLWVGEHITYNYITRQMEAREFRTGKPPVFVAGEGLHAEYVNTNVTTFSPTNLLLRSTNAYLTADDIADPGVRIRAKSVTVIPGKKVIARHATLYVGEVPLFYWAYYERNLGPRANNFNFSPGYRSSYGAFLLNSYQWYLSDQVDTILHADYRTRRGPGLGPDLNFHLGRWGDGSLRYYYLHDYDTTASITITNGNPFSPAPGVPLQIAPDRQRVYFSWVANPYTNLSVRSLIRYQDDPGVLHDFFEREYRQDSQPSTYVEVDKTSQNFSLDVYAQPRLNSFLETVERLPDVRLTGYRQQLWESPFYYESESSAGYYRRRFADTNQLFPVVGPYTTTGQTYAAARADTFHQITLPETFFGWLNLTPRVGGRFTYYGTAQGDGAMTEEAYRGVFNTGAELSFKASRVWPGYQSKLFEADGLRHIVEPSINYAYVPTPNKVGTNEIPQFDFELPSLRLLPIDFPDYNSIDTIDSQNVVRMGLRNKIQTKRGGQVVNLVDWNVYADWHLTVRPELNMGIGR
jgi:LPS-assembly protein